jgi:4-amino-4-deoxy-L-arabinose transferase-like glycosyltransferase
LPALSSEDRPSSSARTTHAEAYALLAITALALALRVTSLSRGLFTDEAYSLALAQRGFGHMVGLFGYEANGTPYPIVLWPLIRLFGDGEVLLRLPAVAGGTAAVPALWWAVRAYAPSPAPLIAAGLLALNPMAVFYSQSARPYAFVVLAVCLAFGALARALRKGASRRAWAGYVASMALLGYCEIFAAPLVVPAHALIAWRSGRDGVRRWLLSLGALAIACVPLLVAAVIARGRRDALYWLPKPDRELIVLTLQEFTAGFSGVTGLRWATLAGAGALVAAGLWQVRRRSETARREPFLIAACWGILPVLLLLAVSFIKPLFWPRYVILAIPGLCMLLALSWAGLASSRRGLLAATGCVVVVLAAALAADVKQHSALQENWAPAADVLKAQRAPGAPTILDNALVLPTLGYYYPAFRASDGDLIVQEWHDRPLPAGFVGFKDPTGYGGVPDGPPTVADFRQLARRGSGTVWMVVSEVDPELQSNPREGAAVAWARAHCQVRIHPSVGVWLMQASGCPTGAG